MNQIDNLRNRNAVYFPLLFILAGLVLFSNCASTEADVSNTAPTDPADRTSVSSNASSPSAPLEPSGNAVLPAGMTEQQKKRLEDAFAANVQTPDGTVHPGMKAKPSSRPAPDNSEYSSTLTDVATETRVFKGHPVLNKVERITDSNQVKLRIYLKNGRIIDADGKSMTNMPVASASTFMQIGGLPPLPNPIPAPASATSSKKKQEESSKERDAVPNIRKN